VNGLAVALTHFAPGVGFVQAVPVMSRAATTTAAWKKLVVTRRLLLCKLKT
jgi:hypothetical protein